MSAQNSWGQDRTQGRYGIVPVPLLPGSPTGRLKHCTSLYIISKEAIGIWESALRSRTPRAELRIRVLDSADRPGHGTWFHHLGNWLCKACPGHPTGPTPCLPWRLSPKGHLGRSRVQRSTRHCAFGSQLSRGPGPGADCAALSPGGAHQLCPMKNMSRLVSPRKKRWSKNLPL